jgi:hypothetical protein
MRKILDRVTITGADNSTDIREMVELSKRFPFVEWGILLSGTSQGGARFPDLDWMRSLFVDKEEFERGVMKLPFSGHLCGRWVREICEGKWDFIKELDSVDWPIHQMFTRYQLNFHAYVHKISDHKKFIEGFKTVAPHTTEFVFQLDDVNDSIVDIAKEHINAQPFFDLSGGVGVLPEKWQEAKEGVYTGYAGGLSPENVCDQLKQIEKVCGEPPIWIDVETHVRTKDNQALDMQKVEEFLRVCEPWVLENWESTRAREIIISEERWNEIKTEVSKIDIDLE